MAGLSGALRATAAAALLLGTSCAWVALDPGGREVEITSTQRSADCESVGRASARTRARIGPFPRSGTKVRSELDILARNEAARLGGDTVVPIGESRDGEQRFEVFRCGSQP